MSDLSLRDIKYLQGVGPQRAAILEKELQGLAVLFPL